MTISPNNGTYHIIEFISVVFLCFCSFASYLLVISTLVISSVLSQ